MEQTYQTIERELSNDVFADVLDGRDRTGHGYRITEAIKNESFMVFADRNDNYWRFARRTEHGAIFEKVHLGRRVEYYWLPDIEATVP